MTAPRTLTTPRGRRVTAAALSIGMLCLCVAGLMRSPAHAWTTSSSPTTRSPPPLNRRERQRDSLSSYSSLDTSKWASSKDGDGDESDLINERLRELEKEALREERAIHKIRIMEAQEKIAKILNDPLNPPFDATGELEKVVGIAVGDGESTTNVTQAVKEYAERNAKGLLEETVGENGQKDGGVSSVIGMDSAASADAATINEDIDSAASELEDEMYKAVQRKDLSAAAEHKKALSEMHFDDCIRVLSVHSEFYRTFRHKDVDAMERLWLPDPSSVCIHPLHSPIVGSKNIVNSWKSMFAATLSSTGETDGTKHWMEPHNVRINVRGTTAVVTCDEHVYLRRFVRGQKRQTDLVNVLVATNVFRKVGGKWYLTYHHAAWHADSPLAKMAMRESGGGGGGKKTGEANNIPNRGFAAFDAMASSMEDSNNDADDGDDESALGGILGTNKFGPMISSDGPIDKNEPRVIKRVFSGSLSDILNGNLGDLLGDAMGEGTGEIKGGNGENGGDDNLPIISFKRIGPDGIFEDGMQTNTKDNNEDDDDGDDDDDDDDDGMVKDAFEFVKNFNDRKKKERSAPETSAPTSFVDKDSLRQSCIAALRNLTEAGVLSAKQKRTLLTDIIKCSANAEYSLVEVAYELLGDGDGNMGEFAEQCLIFAEQKEDEKSRGDNI